MLSFGHFMTLLDYVMNGNNQKGESLEDFAIRTFNLYCRFPLIDRPMIQEWYSTLVLLHMNLIN